MGRAGVSRAGRQWRHASHWIPQVYSRHAQHTGASAVCGLHTAGSPAHARSPCQSAAAALGLNPVPTTSAGPGMQHSERLGMAADKNARDSMQVHPKGKEQQQRDNPTARGDSNEWETAMAPNLPACRAAWPPQWCAPPAPPAAPAASRRRSPLRGHWHGVTAATRLSGWAPAACEQGAGGMRPAPQRARPGVCHARYDTTPHSAYSHRQR